MTLAQKQQLFSRLLGEWLVWVYQQPGVSVALGEGYVGMTDSKRKANVHKANGNHYKKLAQDIDLFVNGQYIADGSHPVWTTLGEKWESMNPLCSWGGRFQDANHLSLEHEGIK